MALRTASPALSAYEAVADTYDTFTAAYDHQRWLERIVALAREHGLAGGSALDVGCGTGKSAQPLMQMGFAVTAVDVSPSMAAVATRRLGARADVLVADMRELPDTIGPFALVTCLDDAINYLTDVADLRAAFASARQVLAPDGLYVFDVNTLHAYASAFDQDFVAETESIVFCWSARSDAASADQPDSVHVAQLDTFRAGPGGTWTRQTGVHRQRHFSHETIEAALRANGLRSVDVLGQTPGVQLSRPADETHHNKRLYVVARAD